MSPEITNTLNLSGFAFSNYPFNSMISIGLIRLFICLDWNTVVCGFHSLWSISSKFLDSKVICFVFLLQLLPQFLFLLTLAFALLSLPSAFREKYQWNLPVEDLGLVSVVHVFLFFSSMDFCSYMCVPAASWVLLLLFLQLGTMNG